MSTTVTESTEADESEKEIDEKTVEDLDQDAVTPENIEEVEGEVDDDAELAAKAAKESSTKSDKPVTAKFASNVKHITDATKVTSAVSTNLHSHLLSLFLFFL